MVSWKQTSTDFLGSDRLSLALRGREAYGGIHQRAWVEVDLAAIAENVQQIKTLLSPQTGLMAVVKADAYGHGATFVAQILSQAGVSGFAIATIPEGIELREAGINKPILVLGAVHTPDEVRAIAHWQLQPTLCTPQQALLFSATLSSLNQSLAVQLNIDTGMSRLGTPWQQTLEFVQLVRRLPNLTIAGIYSHFATADDPDPTILQQQHQRFKQVITEVQATGYWDWNTRRSLSNSREMARQPLEVRHFSEQNFLEQNFLEQNISEQQPLQTVKPARPLLHIANSAATLTNQTLHHDLVRVGLALYGLYPAPHLKSAVCLKPALQVKARITQVKSI
ncbi:MAG: alanine racemase, partial [Microcoleaceae cyanobacterium]